MGKGEDTRGVILDRAVELASAGGRLAATEAGGERRCLGCALADDLWTRDRRRAG